MSIRDGRPDIGDTVMSDVDGPTATCDWLKDTTKLGGERTLIADSENTVTLYFKAVNVVVTVVWYFKRDECLATRVACCL